ncbi:MAG TPA: Rubrerythrin-2 [Lentisphaeria bacterium]|nr:MAG: Rubrerythrin-2 [Lentisphaerae bacterium GWF2_38_69]HBM17332.1 Rubrerythrin-2 [Lentisphaeria bacterium]
MRAMTEQNLIDAFGGESQAHMRYLKFSEVASQEKLPNVSRLFSAISRAEIIHAHSHYKNLSHLKGGRTANSGATFGPGDTLKNLELALMGETFEVEEMYPVYIEVAKFQKEAGASTSFERAFATEQMHKALFEKAIAAVGKRNDVELNKVHVCSVCGYTLENESAPEICPVCSAKKEKYISF